MRVLSAVAGTLAFGAAGFGYAAGIERNAFRVRTRTVPVLAPGQPPLRVLHLSDVHMTGAQSRKQSFVRGLADYTPDLVAVTGDNLSSADGIPAMLDALQPLAHLPGVFVLGSNDYYAPRWKNPLKYFKKPHKRVLGNPLPWRELAAGFEAYGWIDLTNRRAEVDAAARHIDLVGVDDPHLKRDRLEVVDGPADAAADLRLALVHAPEPRVLDRFEAARFDLLLAGHTHGGQLRLPGYGAIVTNCGIDRARARGLSRYGRAWLHVSPGLGTSPYAPVRFACPPEATILELVSR